MTKEEKEQWDIFMKTWIIPALKNIWGEKKCKEIVEALEEWEEQEPWIPVSERLPEEDGQYLITVKYKHVNDSYENVYAEHGEWYNDRWDMFCFEHCGEVEEIIAWMPLPEPYEPQESEEE